MPVIQNYERFRISPIDQIPAPVIRSQHWLRYVAPLEKIDRAHGKAVAVEVRIHQLLGSRSSSVGGDVSGSDHHDNRPDMNTQLRFDGFHTLQERSPGNHFRLSR